MKLFSRILLVDDDAVINFMNKKILTREDIGDDIQLFSNATAALNEITQSTVQPGKTLVLLDINMPVMDGWEFLDKFEQQDETIQSVYHIVMLTSSISAEDIRKSKTYTSVQGFISKPLTAEKLRKVLPAHQ